MGKKSGGRQTQKMESRIDDDGVLDVLSLDSRVNIDPTENHSSGLGYINASFITAEANPPDLTVSQFIATQGPLPTTYEDFWKMVLQHHCPAVVMLTRLVDPPEDEIGNGDIMCGDYFQGENGVRIIGGNIHTVTQKFTKTNSSLELRHLELNYAEDPPRPVLHIFFPDWPDNGAPRETLAVREIYRRLNHLPSSQVPIVVHCSAGVGRTGTYCVIHNTLQRILVGDLSALELYETVTTFKSQRRGMVQSEWNPNNLIMENDFGLVPRQPVHHYNYIETPMSKRYQVDVK
nr:protein-tyrosine-phosphatase PTP1 [Tanacetum cinerariifolium]